MNCLTSPLMQRYAAHGGRRWLTKEMNKTLAFINAATAMTIICLMAWTALPSSPIDKDVAIIGGSNSPTAIWVTTDKMDAIAYFIPVLFCVLLLANTYALYRSKKEA